MKGSMRLPIGLGLLAGLAACGRHPLEGVAPRDGAADQAPGDGAAEQAPRLGLVDVTKAPPTLELRCGGAAGVLPLKMPCLVGMNIVGSGQPVGLHETECRIAGADEPIVWSFLLPLGALAQNPALVLHLPGDLPTTLIGSGSIDLNGEQAHVSGVTGTLSFSRVDPQGRAFEGAFRGRIVWKGATSGAETACDVDGPFWGAPGDFR